MDDKLTTINGPLHDVNTADTALDEREIVAFYSSAGDAAAARDSLVASGVPADCISLQSPADQASAASQPADRSIIGTIRQAIAPDEPSQLPQAAIRDGEVRLAIKPARQDVERIVALVEATRPHHFDARLERWRNSA